MEEFDFDINNDIGTSVLQLKNQLENKKNNFNYDVDTDIQSFNYDNNREELINKMTSTIDNNIIDAKTPRKKQNINKFVRNLENNLDNYNERIPDKLTKQKINSYVLEPMTNINNEQKKSCLIDKIEIIICILLFMLLNNKLIIGIIYNIPLLQKINSPYPNLLIRTIIFGVILYLIKKFNI
jgi:hypothetical protein